MEFKIVFTINYMIKLLAPLNSMNVYCVVIKHNYLQNHKTIIQKFPADLHQRNACVYDQIEKFYNHSELMCLIYGLVVK